MSAELHVEGTLAGAEPWNPTGMPGMIHLGAGGPERAVEVLNDNHLSNLLRDAGASGLRLLPLGGGRGGPRRGARADVVLDLRRLRRVLTWDRESSLVRAEAGVTFGELSAWLERSGASLAGWRREHPSSTLGGLLSAWQPVQHALWGGSVREACVGLSAVTGDGALYTYVPAPRKASGPDLRHLFIGGDGVFGVIASAWLGVSLAPEARRALRVRCGDHEAALRFLGGAFGAGLRCPNALYSGSAREVWLLLEGAADVVALMDGAARRAAKRAGLEARAMDPDGYYTPAAGDVRAGADPVAGRAEGGERAVALWGGLEELRSLPEEAWREGVLYDISAHQAALHLPAAAAAALGLGSQGSSRAAWWGAAPQGQARRAARRVDAALKAALDPRGVLPALEDVWGAEDDDEPGERA